jgi:hypothetical protein
MFLLLKCTFLNQIIIMKFEKNWLSLNLGVIICNKIKLKMEILKSMNVFITK